MGGMSPPVQWLTASVTATMTTEPPRQESRLDKLLVVVGILVLAFNLRTAIGSVGAVLDDVTTGLSLHPAEAGLLTTLPVICFAVVGALAPRLAHHVGVHRLTFLGLLLVSLALWGRTEVSSAAWFLVLSFVALTGAATANVLLPSLVKLHFPHRIGLLTAIYSTAMAGGMMLASVATVPLAQGMAGDGEPLDWRGGLVFWALVALVAAAPWIALVRHDRTTPDEPHTIGVGDVARTRLGWAMAVFFGLQSLQAYSIFGWFAKVYRDAGFAPDTAGLLLGVITGIGVPLSFLVPWLTARVHDQRWLLVAIMACYPVGYLGLAYAPVSGAWAWALAVGAGASTFPYILTLIGLRARTPGGTAALSGFAQSTGYLIAAIGPFGMGLLHDASGGWVLPLWALTVLTVPQLLVGLYVSRPVHLEDEIAAR